MPLNLQDFLDSLEGSEPPVFIQSPILLGLWYEGKGDWYAAHEIAQSKEGVQEYDCLHAYLHRVEGDEWNAGYWYRRAGTKMPSTGLKEEWEQLVKKYLEQG